MKQLMHLLLWIALIPGITIPASAQVDEAPMIPEDKLQEIKTQKVAFLTQRVDLTTEEAQKFWPVYNQYDKEVETLRKERREAMKSMKQDSDPTEAEAAAAIDKELASQQKELDLRKRYAGEFKKTIGAVKTLKLGRAEREFNRELLKRMHDRGQGGEGRPGSEGRPGGSPRR